MKTYQFSTDDIQNKYLRRAILFAAVPFVIAALLTLSLITISAALLMMIRDEARKFYNDFKTDLIPRIKRTWKL